MKMMKKILNNPFLKFLFGFIKVMIWIFVILIVLVIGIQRLFNNQVSIGSYRMFTVVTGSMMPEYDIYDVIIIKEKQPDEIRVGDDLTYLGKTGDYKDRVITHRVKKVREENGTYYYTTQGTANNTPDPEIREDQMYGIVVYRPQVLSWLSHILNNSYGLYFLVFVPIAILIFLEILDYIKEKESELSDEEENTHEKDETKNT